MIEERFFVGFIHCFFIAFGVIIGGSIIGSIGSFATGDPPISAIQRIAKGLRIWAIAASIGGTFDAIATFERGIFDGSSFDIVKQVLYIFSAMAGVKTGIVLLSYLIQEDLS